MNVPRLLVFVFGGGEKRAALKGVPSGRGDVWGGLNMELQRKNPIQLVVETAWVVDAITSLGGGYLYHLTYAADQVESELLSDLRNGEISAGHPIEILHLQSDCLKRTALAEMEKFLDYRDFIRIDLRILQVSPSLRRETPGNGRKHLCRYRDY